MPRSLFTSIGNSRGVRTVRNSDPPPVDSIVSVGHTTPAGHFEYESMQADNCTGTE